MIRQNSLLNLITHSQAALRWCHFRNIKWREDGFHKMIYGLIEDCQPPSRYAGRLKINGHLIQDDRRSPKLIFCMKQRFERVCPSLTSFNQFELLNGHFFFAACHSHSVASFLAMGNLTTIARHLERSYLSSLRSAGHYTGYFTVFLKFWRVSNLLNHQP